jgi:hypothetical protein
MDVRRQTVGLIQCADPHEAELFPRAGVMAP